VRKEIGPIASPDVIQFAPGLPKTRSARSCAASCARSPRTSSASSATPRRWPNAAVGKVLDKEKAASWNLKAFKYYYIPWQQNGVAGIVVAPTSNLIKLQDKLIHAVARYTTKNGTAAAFAAPPEDPEINQPTIDYVATFVPKATGEHFNPHVTVGIASQDYLKKMLAEPFDVFTFSPAGAALYQLGNFGTARKQLKAWELKS
jgi:hypothetical protein